MTEKELRKKMWLDINKKLKGVRKVRRKAKEGEWILIVRPTLTAGLYKEGDILQVNDARTHDKVHCNGVTFRIVRHCIYDSEYVVLENYIPEDKPKKIEEPVTIVEHLVKDRKTIVKLSNGKVGVAVCSPEDEFDIYEGLRLATERAYGKAEPYKKPSSVKEVERKAKVGEYVKIVTPMLTRGIYKKGDVLLVKYISVFGEMVSCVHTDEVREWPFSVYNREYVVLENYKPKK